MRCSVYFFGNVFQTIIFTMTTTLLSSSFSSFLHPWKKIRWDHREQSSFSYVATLDQSVTPNLARIKGLKLWLFEAKNKDFSLKRRGISAKKKVLSSLRKQRRALNIAIFVCSSIFSRNFRLTSWRTLILKRNESSTIAFETISSLSKLSVARGTSIDVSKSAK